MKHLLITTIAAVVLVGCGNPELDEKLRSAAEDGNIEDVKKLLGAGANVNSHGPGEYYLHGTSLHNASGEGHSEIVKLLISKGANVNANNIGATPLHAATGYLPHNNGAHKEIVKMLMENGADINAKTKDGFTPLDTAILAERRNKQDNGASDLLRTQGAKSGAETSLLVAASLGDVQSIKKLLNTGEDINKQFRGGNTPLHITASYGHKNATEQLLVSGANINCKDDQGRTPLFKAVRSRKKEIVELLIAKGADINTDTGLHTLARAYSDPAWSQKEQKQEKERRSEKVEIAELLISKGVDVNRKNYGDNALHIATQSGHEEMAEQLIEAGANINESNNGNQTPLHKAAFEGRDKIVNILIQKGAKVNPVIKSTGSFNGMTPVDFAIRQNKLKTADLLRKHGGKTGEELKAEGK